MCPKIDVMERYCKMLEFRGDLNRPQHAIFSYTVVF
jgi:hypothetical protein